MRILVLHYKCASVSASKFEKLESWCLVIASRLPRCTMQLQKRTSSWFLNPPAEFLLATEQEGTCALPLSRLDGCLRMVTGAINMASNVGQCHLLGSWTRVAPVTIFCLLTQPADLLSAAGASFEERGDTFLPPCFLSFIHSRGQNEARLPGSTAARQ